MLDEPTRPEGLGLTRPLHDFFSSAEAPRGEQGRARAARGHLLANAESEKRKDRAEEAAEASDANSSKRSARRVSRAEKREAELKLKTFLTNF